MLHFISDTHFSHARIITMCNRPFKSIKEMNDTMINKWNEQVKPGDTVIHIGDFGNPQKLVLIDILERLNGEKILIMGNHDKFRNAASWKTCGFSQVLHELEMDIGGKKCLLRHVPMEPINRIPPQIDYIVCGHIHNIRNAPPRHVNVSVEVCDYRPLNEHELIERFKHVRIGHTYQYRSTYDDKNKVQV